MPVHNITFSDALRYVTRADYSDSYINDFSWYPKFKSPNYKDIIHSLSHLYSLLDEAGLPAAAEADASSVILHAIAHLKLIQKEYGL